MLTYCPRLLQTSHFISVAADIGIPYNSITPIGQGKVSRKPAVGATRSLFHAGAGENYNENSPVIHFVQSLPAGFHY